MILTVTLNPSLDEWVHLPSLLVGRLNRATGFTRYPGGKGINVSRVVRELGGRTMALALAGGADGHILSAQLSATGIAHQFVQVPGLTRNNYQLQTVSPPAVTQVNCPGPRASRAALAALRRLLLRHAAQSSAVALSGSLPPGAPVATYRDLVAAVRRTGALPILDTSGPSFKQGLGAKPWLIKPNKDEASEVLGRRLDRLPQVAAAARALLRLGPELAVISLGPDGALLAAQGQRAVWHARPPKVQVDSTVGAGDSLVAGLTVGWLRTGSLEKAFRLGVACGAATAMTPGTELCHRRDVLRLAPRVRISRLA